jgi:hypothetical protein
MAQVATRNAGRSDGVVGVRVASSSVSSALLLVVFFFFLSIDGLSIFAFVPFFVVFFVFSLPLRLVGDKVVGVVVPSLVSMTSFFGVADKGDL